MPIADPTTKWTRRQIRRQRASYRVHRASLAERYHTDRNAAKARQAGKQAETGVTVDDRR